LQTLTLCGRGGIVAKLAQSRHFAAIESVLRAVGVGPTLWVGCGRKEAFSRLAKNGLLLAQNKVERIWRHHVLEVIGLGGEPTCFPFLAIPITFPGPDSFASHVVGHGE
jgi:hypothetical protein